MGVTVATVRVNASIDTAPYTQDIITTDLGGLTPKAAILYTIKADVDGTVEADAGFGMGFTDGTSEYVMAMLSEDGGADSAVVQGFYGDSIVRVWNAASGGMDAQAEVDSFITNGIRINWTVAPNDDWLIVAVLFAGTDLSAKAGVTALGNAIGTVAVTTVGFEADMVWHMGAHLTYPGWGTRLEQHYGVSHNDGAGGVSERCVAMMSIQGQATAANYQWIRSADACFDMLGNGNIDWSANTQTYDSSGWDYNVKNRGANSTSVAWLALSFGGAVEGWVGTYTCPTSTGDDAITSPGFKPQIVGFIPSLCTSVDTEFDTNVYSFGAMVFDADNEYSLIVSDEDAAATMDAQSLCDDVAVNFPTDDGVNDADGTFVSFDTNGWTLNYSDAPSSAWLWAAWAIEEEAVSGEAFFAALADTVGITDTLVWSIGRSISLGDSVGITDTLIISRDIIKTISDPVGITDTITTIREIIKSITDSIGVTDILSRSAGRFVSLADSIEITDVLSTTLVKIVSLADSVGITDVVSNSVGRIVALADSIGITDTIATVRDIIKSLSESVGVTDVLTRSAGRVISFVESVGITDAMTAIKGGATKFVELADSIGITDTIVTARDIIKSIFESVGVTDVLSTSRDIIKLLSESVGVTDILSRSAGRFVSLADSIGITDVIDAIKMSMKFVSLEDSVGITDIVTTSRNIIKLLSDNVGVTDILSTTREIIKFISETVGITDVLDRSAGRFVSFVESVGITDVLSRSAGRFVSLFESVGVTDALLTARNIIKSISDVVGVTDLLSTARSLVRSVSDSIGITDTIVATRGVLVSLSDVVGITDSLSVISAVFIKTVLFLQSLLGIILKQRSQVFTGVTLISQISTTTISLISRIYIISLISQISTTTISLISRIEKEAEE